MKNNEIRWLSIFKVIITLSFIIGISEVAYLLADEGGLDEKSVQIGDSVQVEVFQGEHIEGVLRQWSQDGVLVETFSGEKLIKIEDVKKVVSLGSQKSDLKGQFEEDFKYFKNVVSESGVETQKKYLVELIKKYESKGLDQMYLLPAHDALESLNGKMERAPYGSEFGTWTRKDVQPRKEKKTQSEKPIMTFVLKWGTDYAGKHKVSGSGGSTTDTVYPGFNMTFEIIPDRSKSVFIGGGLSFQGEKELKRFQGSFGFIPIYSFLQFNFSQSSTVTFATLQTGYSFFYGDGGYKGPASLGGGLYLGFGGGVLWDDKYRFDLLYAINNGTYELPIAKLDVEYSSLKLTFGVTF